MNCELKNDSLITIMEEQLSDEDMIFTAAVQPIVNAKTVDVLGFEVLSRSKTQPINIDAFFREKPSCITSKISMHVLTTAMQHFQHQPKRLQFNLSPGELMEDYTLRTLVRLLESGYPSNLLYCELTEHACIQSEEVRNVLEFISTLGVKISLDDFGRACSNYARLFELPISQVKIDRQFITDIQQCKKSQEMVRHMINFVPLFNEATVVFEGVEEISQHTILTEMGAMEAQGYLYATPKPLRSIDPSNLSNVITNSYNYQ